MWIFVFFGRFSANKIRRRVRLSAAAWGLTRSVSPSVCRFVLVLWVRPYSSQPYKYVTRFSFQGADNIDNCETDLKGFGWPLGIAKYVCRRVILRRRGNYSSDGGGTLLR